MMKSGSFASILLITSITLLCIACGDDARVAGAGESCGPDRGCAEGLVCWQGICREIGAVDAGTTDAGTTDLNQDTAQSDGTPPDEDSQAADGTPAKDGPVVTDGPPQSDGPACGPCNQPPSDCYAKQGQCVGGVCTYDVVPGATCNDENPCTLQDTCEASGSCTGTPMVCNTPQPPACISNTELRVYDATGECQGGLCVYTPKTIVCDDMCQNNACTTDPCSGMTCTTPPSSCFSSVGTCSLGSCSYPFAEGVGCNDGNSCTDSDACNAGVCVGLPKACTTPPPNECVNNNTTAKIYQPVGTCSAGVCSYPVAFVSCATGCSGGACNPSGWTSMISNVSLELYSVWGSSPSAVWAVGQSGTSVFYDGAVWKAIPTGVTENLLDVHGSAANNVFAISEYGKIIKYDGSGWSVFRDLGVNGDTCLYVTGTDTLWAAGPEYPDGMSLYQVDSTSETKVAHTGEYGITGKASCDIDVSAAAGVWLAGTKTVHLTPPSTTEVFTASHGIYAAPDGTVFWTLWSTATQWTASSGAQVLNTGNSGSLYGIDGNSSANVYAAGWGSGQGLILRYDGQGWIQEPIPAGLESFWDVWVASSGEVFAVGSKGNVLKGP